jgi:hypothetical protein
MQLVCAVLSSTCILTHGIAGGVACCSCWIGSGQLAFAAQG